MQPGPVPEDIDTILSRFHTWAEKQPAPNGNGSAHGNGNLSDASSEEVREIPYEEAMRRHRSRRTAQTVSAKPTVKKKAAPRQTSPAAPASSPPVAEAAPIPEKKPPFVPSLELLAALRSAAAAPVPREVAPQAQLQPILFREETEPEAEVTPEPTLPLAKASASPSSPSVRPSPAVKRHVSSKTDLAAAIRELVDRETARADAPTTVGPNAKPKLKRPRPQKATLAAPSHGSMRAAKAASAPRLPAPPAKVVQPMLRARPAIPGTGTAAARTPARGKAAPSQAARPRQPRHPAFHQVLTTTVQQPRIPNLPTRKGVPERTRRITTRFTAAEERRIEKQASLLGLTVSAYLRHCALATVTPAEAPPPSATLAPRSKAMRENTSGPWTPNPQAAQGSSLIGGWLALLRNRFLGPPILFSEDA